VPIGFVAILLALVASMGGFIFGYDTGQISDVLVMEDFKHRFATCTIPGDVSSCKFSTVRSGLIVSLLSIGTLVGALAGAPLVMLLFFPFFSTDTVAAGIALPICLDDDMLWSWSVGYLSSALSSR
jgi:MFS transporter, SP family, sugar:H+ symporter